MGKVLPRNSHRYMGVIHRFMGVIPRFTSVTFWMWLLITCSATAQAADLPEVDISTLQQQWLRDIIEFLPADVDQPFTSVTKSDFSPLTHADINQGISDRAFWLRMRLLNADDAAKPWVLHNDTSYLDNLVVYYRDENTAEFQQQHLSDRQPFHTRPLDYRALSFRHATPAHSYTDVYVKVFFDKPDSVSLNFGVWEENTFWQTARNENLIYGGYYGILLILIIISLSFALLLRQRIALYYSVFLIGTALLWLFLNGYAFQYLWPNAVYWHNEGFHIAFLLFAMFALQFSKAFLRTHTLQPKMHRFFTALQLVIACGLLLRIGGAYGVVLDVAFGALALLAVVIPVASWRAYRRGLTYARWYTLAWLVYSLSVLVCVTSGYTNFLQWGMQVLNYMQAGSLLESIFLMVAMSEWLLSLDTDRRQAIALANQDPLTGLGNRRLLQLQYEQLRECFLKDGQPVFLIMMDLDHFKQINDTYGHEAGDYVLKEVAELIEHLSREGDVCIRYGGEEFAMLLRADSMDRVWQIAERIRIQFGQNPTQYNGQVIQHTLSSGITQVLSTEEILTVQEMMARADAALYQGKAAGRNCSTIYDSDSVVNSRIVSISSA